MNEKYTPSPWFIKNDDGIFSERSGLWVATIHTVCTKEEQSENARLIAAAPELLEALIYAIDNPEFLSLKFDKMARAAIAKVKGES